MDQLIFDFVLGRSYIECGIFGVFIGWLFTFLIFRD